ncbi:hypothetical protein [Methylophaga sulfidovorans]|uniref:Uncharacterized protein n=1 Tax=Methylophaga sulfidovorans TaxID=45496 RepID=A0A1I3YYP5_9GAMM|nr:hypothetical protein [Methylophaga sulfidovorans]SFK36953.1 hypothetical protein SAMN04488079_10954 [Methylophaga sulfidovorans]
MELETLSKRVAQICDVSVEKAKNLVLFNVNKSKELTLLYGSEQISRAILLPDHIDDDEDLPQLDIPNLVDDFAEPDFDYLMKVSQEMAQVVQELPPPSISIVLEMTLEGLTRGLGMDRAIFMLLNETRTKLTCKSGLGKQVDELKQQLIIDLATNQAFKNVVEQRQPLLLMKNDKDYFQTNQSNNRRLSLFAHASGVKK